MHHPRIKFEHRPRRFSDGRIHIGGHVYGIASELKDPHGWVWAMLEALDGTRTVDQVVTHLIHRFPRISANDIRAGIDQIIQAGYVEDSEQEMCVSLSERERERYSRGRAFHRWVDLNPRDTTWYAQLRLRGARVIIIGLGGAGGVAALALATSGVGRLHCVEPDVVELSNLNRQILYTENDIGRPKVEVAVERLQSHNSDIIVTGEQVEVTGPKSLEHLLVPQFDALVLGADRPAEIRSWTNQACRAMGIPWVHGGYHGPQVTVGAFKPGTGPCYDCVRTAETERRASLSSQREWSPAAHAIPEHAATAISAGMAGNLAAHAVMSMLTGVPQLPINCMFGLNLIEPDHSFVLALEQPRSDCPACGGAP